MSGSSENNRFSQQRNFISLPNFGALLRCVVAICYFGHGRRTRNRRREVVMASVSLVPDVGEFLARFFQGTKGEVEFRALPSKARMFARGLNNVARFLQGHITKDKCSCPACTLRRTEKAVPCCMCHPQERQVWLAATRPEGCWHCGGVGVCGCIACEGGKTCRICGGSRTQESRIH